MPQENNNQPISADYLNQIAAPQTKKGAIFGKNRLLITLLLCCLSIATLFSVITTFSNNDNKLAILAARLDTVNTIAESSSNNLKNSNIRATNGNLKIFLTNTITELGPELELEEININKLDKKIIQSESDESMKTRLEDARLNAVFDRTYAREMAFKLETTLTLMKQIYQSTKNNDLKTILTDAYNNLQPTKEAFANFNSSNS